MKACASGSKPQRAVSTVTAGWKAMSLGLSGQVEVVGPGSQVRVLGEAVKL